MGSSSGVKTKQNTVEDLNTLATSSYPRIGSSVTGANPCQPMGINRGTRKPRPGVATRLGVRSRGWHKTLKS